MAKKNKVTIDVEAKGKGFKKVAVESKQAGDGLDAAANGSENFSKKQKGVAGATSNSTKAFAKMQMGSAGLVGAYASLAAQLFAISAAFNFLKSAGDLKVLQQGQIAYASSTGIAMRVLANQIQEATNAQITFQDASQAAAIGTAAGLSQQQLKDLGTAAKDTSLILGRDVTDSFNRLVRGVTKAEPELLDELGVILRLNDANEKYAAKLGKSVSQLTQFEKSQAVANDVLEQTQEKYSNIIGSDTEVNQYAQLAKAFDDILISVKKVVDTIVGPFAKVLTETPMLGVAALGLLVKGPLAAMGFEFKNVTAASKEALEAQRKSYGQLKKNAEAAKLSVGELTKKIETQAIAFNKAGSTSAIFKKVAEGGKLTGTDKANLNKAVKAAEAQYRQHGEIVKGIFKGMDIAIVKDFRLAMKQMADAESGLVTSTKRMEAQFKLSFASIKLGFQTLKTAAITFGATLLNALGWVSLIASLFMVAADHFGWFEKKQTKAQKEAEKLSEKLKSLNEQYTNFLEIQMRIMNVSGSTNTAMSAIGNQLSALSTKENIIAVNDYIKVRNELLEVEKEIATAEANNREVRDRGNGVLINTKELNQRRESLRTTIDENYAYDDQIPILQKALQLDRGRNKAAKELLKILTNGGTKEQMEAAFLNMQNLGSAISAADQAIKAANQSVQSFFGNLSQNTAGDNALNDIRVAFSAMEDNFKNLGINTSGLGTLGGINAAIKEIRAERQKAMQEISMEEVYSGRQEFIQPFMDRELRTLLKMKEQYEKIETIVEQEHRAQMALLGIEERRSAVLNNSVEYQRNLVNATFNKQKIDQEIINNEEAINALLIANNAVSGDELVDAARRRYEALVQQGRQLVINQGIAKEELFIRQSTLDVEREIYYLKGRSQVLEVQKQQLEMLQKELGFKKSILENEVKLAQFRSNAQNRSEQLGFTNAIKKAAGITEQEQSKRNLEVERAFLTRRIEVINFEAEQKKKSIDLEYKLLEYKLKIAANEAALKSQDLAAKEDFTGSYYQAEIARVNQEMLSGVSQAREGALAALESDRRTGVEGLLDRLGELEVLNSNLSDMERIFDSVGTSFVNSFSEGINALIQGTASVKDAFKNMAVAILKSISEVIAQLIVANLLKAALGGLGGSGGGFGSFIPSGGRSSPGGAINFDTMYGFRRGGIVEQYAEGGIARGREAGYPAILHGTEAVVPLPNGNKIPVEMMNGSGQNNNVTVNVSVDNQGKANSSSQQDSNQAGNLGKAIAKAVQTELQNQKRSGGILNPYGVA